jgi:DNA-binding FrmR family transcriptional regulator
MKYQNIYHRLRRIEGQIRGIQNMINNEKPKKDILIQLKAVKSSMESAIISLIEESLRPLENKDVLIDSDLAKSILRYLKK